jgi:glycosyltransferase involved in cell wall biosynthesis
MPVVVALLLFQSQLLLTVNAGMWLHRALASLLLQNHSKWIAVVVDDASDDNATSQIAAAAAAADSRILHWRNEQRMGALANTVAGSFQPSSFVSNFISKYAACYLRYVHHESVCLIF